MVMLRRKITYFLGLVGSMFILLTAVIDAVDLSRFAGLAETAGVNVSVGYGLWIVMAGAVLALAGHLALLSSSRDLPSALTGEAAALVKRGARSR